MDQQPGRNINIAIGDDNDNNNNNALDLNIHMDEFDPIKAAAQVRRLLSEAESQGPDLNAHYLFIQMDVLARFPQKKQGWKETARWLKYEETVEVGDRWSKPHIPTTQMHSLLELRKFLAHNMCIVALDAETQLDGDYAIADALMEALQNDDKFKNGNSPILIRNTIILPHKHQHRKAGGKSSSTTIKQYDREGRPLFSEDGDSLKKKQPDNHDERKRKAFLRRRSGDGRDIAMIYNSYPAGAHPDNLEPYKPNKHLMKKLPEGCESASILVGQVDYLTETFGIFCRLKNATVMGDLTEVDLPNRFIFLILGSMKNSNIWEFQEMGRTMGTLLSDRVFIEVAYKAKSREDILNGIDEFIDDVTVLPPSLWEPSTRIDPPKQTVSIDQIQSRLDKMKRVPSGPSSPHQEEGATDDPTLQRTGKFCGGLIHDIKKRYRHYASDITDAFALQSLASTVFLFFACITPIVTFGGLMGQRTDGYMGTMETLLSGAVCGTLYALFSGQPLTIVGATGPLLIFESILYHLCKENGFDFMSFRFWIGAWVSLILLVIVAFDLSFLVRYITRFTEESFAILISVIFIYEAFAKMLEIHLHNPIHTGVDGEDPGFKCFCELNQSADSGRYDEIQNSTDIPQDNWTVDYLQNNIVTTISNNWTYDYPEGCTTNTDRLLVNRECITEEQCINNGWQLTGPACYVDAITRSVSDVFLLSLILFIGTFALAMFFRTMRTSRFFPSKVRSSFADFAVLIAVVSFTGIDFAFGLTTPKLNVPAQFVTTRPDRSWIINPIGVTYWWLALLAVVPALLATILIFLDQQITAVIVNRKEHKLKKGHGYHLDLFVLAFLIFICSLFGLPWFVAATVRAITHVRSLMMESEVNIPGERPQMIGVREQRVTGFCIHLLIGLSTLLTVVLKLIPMPVLYGVFLYMGVTSLSGVQFIQRMMILFMPVKYQPDYIFLRHVKTIRVHAFTLIQLACFVLMWLIKQIKVTSIAFPLMLIALMMVRKVLDYIFTQSDLYWLDHLLPEEIRREQEDRDVVEFKSEAKGSDFVTIDVSNASRRRSRTRISITEDPSKNFV